MAPEDNTAPGVFVQEMPGTPPVIEQLATAIPAFVGYTEASTGFEPTRVSSLADYERHFGGASQIGLDAGEPPDRTVPGVPKYLMHYAMRHYFANGGEACFVVSVGGYGARKRRRAFTRGLEALAAADGPTLVVLADAATLPFKSYRRLCRQALEQCEQRRDRFLLVDVPTYEPPTGFRKFRKLDNTALDRAAAYYPYLETSYEFGGGHAVLPPSPAVAGIFCTVDRTRGVWKAPANVSLQSVVAPVVAVDDAEQQGMNVDPVGGKSINAIRQFTGRGILIWGARTLAGNDNEWRYVPVRRLADTIANSCLLGTEWVVFEGNDEPLWAKIRRTIEDYLQGLWRQGAFQGAKPEDAYFVKVGLGQTMTQADVLEGRLTIEIGFAPLKPAEFVILRFMHRMAETS